MNSPPDFTRRVTLGRTGLSVGRLGLGASYGISESACLRAFDQGINYFFWGSFRTEGMGRAIFEISRTHREEIVVVLQCYVRYARLIPRSVHQGLRALGLERADVLLLGWYEDAPSEKVLSMVEKLRAQGKFAHLGLSSHRRSLIAQLAPDENYDLFHVRYNAVHPGAERDLFPVLPAKRPGLVSFTNTCWGRLLDSTRMPPGVAPPPAEDCYRFALSRPEIDVAVCGPKNDDELNQALGALARGPLGAEEERHLRWIGRHVLEHPRLSDRITP